MSFNRGVALLCVVMFALEGYYFLRIIDHSRHVFHGAALLFLAFTLWRMK